MKGKIKILSLLLALAMVASMFVACQPKEDDKKPAASGDEKPAEKVELVWYHWGDEPKNAKPVQEALNAKSEADINTVIDFRWATGDDQKLKTIMATGDDFDIAFTCSWYNNYVLAAQQEQLADITDKVKTASPKLYEFIPESIWDGAKVNGKIYGVPVLKDTAAVQYWYCNKDFVFGDAGAETEWNNAGQKLDSLTPVLEKCKAAAPDGKYPNDLKAPFNFNWAGLNGHDNGWDVLYQPVRVGVRIDDTSATVKSLYEDQDYINELKVLKKWHDNGLSNKDAMDVETEPKFAVVSTAQGFEGAEFTAWGYNKPYKVAIQKKYGPVLTTATIQGSMQGISPDANIDRALLFIQYMNTNVEYRNMLAYGVENTNWKKVTEGDNVFAEALNDDWTPGTFSQATTLILHPVKPAPADMYKKMEQANINATASPLVGFNVNVEKVETQIANCTAIVEKYYKAIQTGSMDDVDATINKVMKELNDAGLQQIKAEFQKQVDAFIASK